MKESTIVKGYVFDRYCYGALYRGSRYLTLIELLNAIDKVDVLARIRFTKHRATDIKFDKYAVAQTKENLTYAISKMSDPDSVPTGATLYWHDGYEYIVVSPDSSSVGEK